MRSITSSSRRLRSRPPRHRHLLELARLIDHDCADQPAHVLVHAIEDPEGAYVDVGVLPLELGVHPFNELAGFTAPSDWAIFGMRVHGTAHHLEGDEPAERTITTYLLHRGGQEASVLRVGTSSTDLTGPAVGTIPDLCHRVLGLATPPAPASTALLWSVAWLDRILERWGDPAQRRALASSWEACARLHPALGSAGDAGLSLIDDPTALIAHCAAHAEAWSWARLRAEPSALALPDGALPVDVTQWMDDGFYARWALGSFPAFATLSRDLSALLDHSINSRLATVLAGVLA